MTLADKQKAFPVFLSRLINQLTMQGYSVTLGEAYRPPETAMLYQMQGKGIKNSLHTQRLAIDLNLFRNNEYLVTTKDYEVAGIIWEGYSVGELKCIWGGRFEKPDSDHFSIEHDGIK